MVLRFKFELEADSDPELGCCVGLGYRPEAVDFATVGATNLDG